MNNSFYVFSMVMVIAAATALLRFLPFMVFGKKQTVPDYVNYLGNILPYAVMAMLVVYCLKNISFANVSLWIPELIAVTVTTVLHIWKRSTLLSILCGTVCYMLLIQFVF